MFKWIKSFFSKENTKATTIESKLLALIKANDGPVEELEDGSVKFSNLKNLHGDTLIIKQDCEINMYYDLLINISNIEKDLLKLIKANKAPVEDLPDGSIKFSNLKDVNGDVLIIKKDIQIKFYSRAYSGEV